MIINQFMVWLQSLFPSVDYPGIAISIYKYPSQSSSELKIAVNLTGGNTQEYPQQFNCNIQITVSHRDENTANKTAYTIYNKIKELYDFEIPAIEGRELTDPAFHVAQIKALDIPGSLGDIGNGIYMYSINVNLKGNFLIDA